MKAILLRVFIGLAFMGGIAGIVVLSPSVSGIILVGFLLGVLAWVFGDIFMDTWRDWKKHKRK